MRSVRDTKEFMEKCLEGIMLLIFYGELNYFKRHTRQMLEIFRTRETSFIRNSHQNILRDYDQQEKISVVLAWIAVVGTSAFILLRSFVKLSPHELEFIRCVALCTERK